MSPPAIPRRRFLRTALLAGGGSLLASCAGRGTSSPGPPELDRPGRRVVVVGGGITALVSAALLSRAGHRVIVLERHPRAVGGHARNLEIDGLEFCVGPQYLWGFGDGDIATRVLERLDLTDELRFTPMAADGFERCWTGDGDEPFDVPVGLERFREALEERFPSEREGLRAFFGALALAFGGASLLHDDGVYLEDGGAMRRALALSARFTFREKWDLLDLSGRTLAEVLEACELSEPLRRLLYANGAIFCENASEVSFFVYAAAVGYYHRGPVYPTRGFAHLVDALVRRVEEGGGEVRIGATVTGLERTGDRVTQVRCADGRSVDADHVVSNLSPRLTCALLTGCTPGRFRYQPSRSAVSCFVGLRDFPEAHALLAGRNGWWQRGDRPVDFSTPDMTAPDLLYVGSPTANGYGNTPRNPGDQGLVLCAPGNRDQERAVARDGAEALAAFRARVTERMLEAADRHVLPGLVAKLRFARLRTPLDIEGDTAAERGSIYGRRLDVATMLRGVRTVPGASNLHVACASTGLPGVENGFNMARLLVERLTGERL